MGEVFLMLANIRNVEYFLNQGVADWSFLNDVFRNKLVKVGDTDGIVEIGGHILVLEKKTLDVMLNQGQRIMYERTSRVGSHTTFVIWYDENDKPEKVMAYFSRALPYKNDTRMYFDVGEEGVIRLVQEWERLAAGYPKVEIERLSFAVAAD